MEKNLTKLENILGVSFIDKDILKQALVHRSYLNEHKNFVLDQNERLEFLGDAVLELAVTDYLFHNFKEAEGVLTNWRSSLVNREQLAQAAEDLGLHDWLYMSRGEAKDDNKKARSYILANTFEAVIGAIYLDQGYAEADKFIKEHLIVGLEKIIVNKSYIDAKTNFQEKAQEVLGITPHYQVLSEEGPDHNKQFVVGIYLDKDLVAKGEGYSKQEAQTSAAHNALELKKWNS
ncbi:ribonuclease III [bacterium]|jgi:ribonuclease III|nr:ribonuclease III [bacterium]MBT4649220.1 ribonuclease III [bacterium]